MFTPLGAVVAATVIGSLAVYHVSLVDDNYAKYVFYSYLTRLLLTNDELRFKQLVAAWRVFVGVWGPRSWDLPLSSLAQYTVAKVPPPNPWIDRPLKKKKSGNATATATENNSEKTAAEPAPVVAKPKAPSRTLIRHVLRARMESTRTLARFMEELERMSPTLAVSEHLGHTLNSMTEQYDPEAEIDYLTATMSGAEVVQYLRDRGAAIAALKGGKPGDWASSTSDSESTLVGGDSPGGYNKVKSLFA